MAAEVAPERQRHSAEQRRERFVELLTNLVDVALKQFDDGYAVDVEDHIDRIAAMAVDHRKIVW